MPNNPQPLDALLVELERLLAIMTPGPWEFRAGDDTRGDSVDLLMAEVGQSSGDEDPEYAEVFFGAELGDAALSVNWEGTRALRNAATRLIVIARAAKELVQNWDDTGEYEVDYINALRTSLEGK